MDALCAGHCGINRLLGLPERDYLYDRFPGRGQVYPEEKKGTTTQ